MPVVAETPSVRTEDNKETPTETRNKNPKTSVGSFTLAQPSSTEHLSRFAQNQSEGWLFLFFLMHKYILRDS